MIARSHLRILNKLVEILHVKTHTSSELYERNLASPDLCVKGRGRRPKIASTRVPNAKRQTLPMEIGRDQNEESSYEVKEGPGDREADEQAEGRLEPLRGHVRGPDRGG